MATSDTRSWQLLTLSAKSNLELKTTTENFINYLRQHPDIDLTDVAYKLQCEQQAFSQRRMVVCRDIEDAIAAFRDPKRVLTNTQEKNRPVAFMFPGLGTHYVNMAWELYQGETVFRERVDRCCEFLQSFLGRDLRDIIYPYRHSQEDWQSSPENSSGLDLRKMLGRSQTQTDPKISSATSLLTSLNQLFL
jgi:acyl transferase domain-containing protein